MAMISCPECGREISDKSEKCIHCGYPLNDAPKVLPEINAGTSSNNSDYSGNSQVVVQNNNTKKHGILLIIGIIAVILIAVVIVIQFDNGESKLDGEYVAYMDIADNLINFSSNGGFARFSRTFGDWELVVGGKYTLRGSTLVLHCSDGRDYEFYYDRESDTMMQEGVNIVFTRLD